MLFVAESPHMEKIIKLENQSGIQFLVITFFPALVNIFQDIFICVPGFTLMWQCATFIYEQNNSQKIPQM